MLPYKFNHAHTAGDHGVGGRFDRIGGAFHCEGVIALGKHGQIISVVAEADDGFRTGHLPQAADHRSLGGGGGE